MKNNDSINEMLRTLELDKRTSILAINRAIKAFDQETYDKTKDQIMDGENYTISGSYNHVLNAAPKHGLYSQSTLDYVKDTFAEDPEYRKNQKIYYEDTYRDITMAEEYLGSNLYTSILEEEKRQGIFTSVMEHIHGLTNNSIIESTTFELRERPIYEEGGDDEHPKREYKLIFNLESQYGNIREGDNEINII